LGVTVAVAGLACTLGAPCCIIATVVEGIGDVRYPACVIGRVHAQHGLG